MYQPIEFIGTSEVAAYEHIVRNPMGIIVSHGAELRATHLPFLLNSHTDPTGVVSHFAIRNEELKNLADGDQVLVIFPGPHAYITPNLYVAEEDVPTWNYSAVHIHGTYRRLPASELQHLLTRTVDEFEESSSQPFSLSTMDPADLASLARAVIPFEVTTTKIEVGVKLSQDKLQPDIDAVIGGLESSGDPAEGAMAAEMKRHRVKGRTGQPSTDPATYLD